MENSKIEWTDHTFKPWIGCQHVSPGCDHCYAEAMMDHRYGKVEWGPHGERKRTSDENRQKPIKWNSESRAFKREHGHRQRVFVPLLPTCSTIRWTRLGATICLRSFESVAAWIGYYSRNGRRTFQRCCPQTGAMDTAMCGLASLLRTNCGSISAGHCCKRYRQG